MKELNGVLLEFRVETGEKKNGSGTWSRGVAVVAEERSTDDRDKYEMTVFGDTLMDQFAEMPKGSYLNINFNIDSRWWTNPNTGDIKNFIGLAISKIVVIELGDGGSMKSTQPASKQQQYSAQAQPQTQYQSPAPKAAAALSSSAGIPDDLPF